MVLSGWLSLYGLDSRQQTEARRSRWLNFAPRRSRMARKSRQPASGLIEALEDRRVLTPINVAVIGNGFGGQLEGGFNQIVSQLNNSTRFDFNATLINASQADTLAELQAYDAVVIGDEGNALVDFATFAPALRSFVEAGGGVVGVGWLIYGAGNYTPPAIPDIDAIIPVDTIDIDIESFGSNITPNATVHPVTAGVAEFTASGGFVSTPSGNTQPKVDAGATVLGTSFSSITLQPEPSIVTGDVMLGRSVYLGAIYSARTDIYSDANLRSGDGDRLLEQAVAWSVRPDAAYVDDDWSLVALGDDPDGAGPATALGFDAFATIQDAVDAASVGATIHIHAGTYAEAVTIDKDLTLNGSSGVAADVIIDPPGAATDGVTLSGGADITIEDLTVTGALSGIVAGAIGELSLTNVAVSSSAEDGLRVAGADNVTVLSSSFTNNLDDGLDLSQVTTLISLTNTTVTGNTDLGLQANLASILTLDGGSFSGLSAVDINTISIVNNAVTSSGNVLLEADEALTLSANLDAGAGTIDLKANLSGGSFDLTMDSGVQLKTTNDTPNAVSLQVNTLIGGTGDVLLGDVQAGTTGTPAGGKVLVAAAMGAVLDNNGAAANITAGNADLSGVSGVGTNADALETAVTHLQGAGGTGGFLLDNTGALIVDGVTTTTGDIRIFAHSPLTVAGDVIGGGLVFLKAVESAGSGDDLTVNAGATVRSTGGNVVAEAGDNLTLQATSLVEALAGTVSIKGDCDNADAPGSTITIAGIINSLNGATVNGDTDSDHILVSAMGTGGLLLDGLAGSDSYEITYPDLPETFGSTITVNDSAGADDRVTVYGTNQSDELFLTTEDPPTTATTEEVSRGAVGTERIVLHDGIEALTISLLDEIDTLHAQPSMLFPVFLDGGDPCFGDPGVPPGDVLDFDSLGNPFTLSGKTIFTANGSPDPFFGVTFTDFESLPLTPIGTSPVMQFDFNHTNTAASMTESPTQSGFTGVLRDTLVTDGLGYGWQNEVQSFERDENFYTETYADLIRDGHQLNAPETFTVELDNGWYLVSAMLGSPYTSVSGVSITDADTGLVMASGITSGPGESTHVSFAVLVADGTLDLTFGPASVYPEIFAVNGLSIRPGVILSMGLECPPGGLEADGVTIDTFTLAEAPPNSLITVTTSLGTLMNVDADDELAGIQVLTNGAGQADILIRRPTGAGTALVAFEEVTGAETGCSSIDYVLPDGRNFDFNHINVKAVSGPSPTQAPVADPLFPGGFLGVAQNQLYSSSQGFGWLSSPRGFDLGTLSDPLGNLKRDGAIDNVSRTFRVDLPNGTYEYQATIGWDQDVDGMQIDANGSVTSGLSVDALGRRQVTGTFTVNGGQALFTFSDLSGVAPNWAINGLQIRSLSAVTPIVFTPNIGGVPSDGMTVTPVTAATSLADGEQVTVSTSTGTITTTDVNPAIDGVQILVAGGTISFSVLSPTQPGTPTLTAVSLDGAHFGTVTDPAFLTFAAPTGRRYDFNHVRRNASTGPSPTAAGFIGVLRTDTNPAATGYGWTVAPNSYDVGVPNGDDQGGSNTYSKLTTDLYRDYHSGHVKLGNRTFQILASPGTLYDLSVYLGAQDTDTSVTVTVEGVAGSQTLNLAAKSFSTLEFQDASDTNLNGFIDVTFSAANIISPFWAVNGIDIVEDGSGLPLPAPLTPAEQTTGMNQPLLTTEELTPVVTLAINAWSAQGLTPDELARLSGATIVIQDLSGIGALAVVDTQGRILVDDDGAGFGWSLTTGQPDPDRYDLLTTVAHELGHLLGHADLDASSAADELMAAVLNRGERHDVLNGIDGFFASVN